MGIPVLAARTVVVLAALIGGSEVTLPPPGESSDLVAYQRRCTLAQAALDLKLVAATNGRMGFTDAESFRSGWVALEYAKQGIGIANSLHTMRLARDKNLVVDGKITFNPADYRLAGEMWISLGPHFGITPAWGGNFTSVDAVHFSCVWKGTQ